MKRLIRKILREEIEKSDKYYRFLDKISSIIEKPYFRNMYERYNGGFWDITDEDDQEYIMKKILGNDIRFEYDVDGSGGYDDKGNMIYYEYSSGYCYKYEYDDSCNRVYYEENSGYWSKYEYNDKGFVISRDEGYL